MPQGVSLSEQKGFPCVLRWCFKRERAKSKTSCFMRRCSSHHPRAAGGEGMGDSFPCSIKMVGLGAQALL